MRLSVIQLSPGADKGANIAQAQASVGAAVAADRPDLVVLPEMWTCLGGTKATKLAAAETLPEPGQAGGDAYEAMRGMARAHRLYVHGGSIGESYEGGDAERLFNTTVVFDPDGREVARYRKMHLFDIVTPDGQGYRESATYGAGDDVVTCKIGAAVIGLAICYDIRFPELFMALRRKGAELIALPAAFTVQTGRDHWEILIRARAIETQCWFAAAGTVGRHVEITRAGEAERFTYGHSLICDPWGHVVAGCSDRPGYASGTLDPSLTTRIRRDMPVVDHRRGNTVYAN